MLHLLLVFGSSQAGVELTNGIHSYWTDRSLRVRWTVVSRSELASRLDAGWEIDDIDGIIGYLGTSAALLPDQLPRVSFSSVRDDRQNSTALNLCPHAASIGRSAARHLNLLGYRHLATFGSDLVEERRKRNAAFAEEAEKLCCTVSSFRVPGRAMDLSAHQTAMFNWFTSLERPVGIFFHQDKSAAEFINLMHTHELLPDHRVAILGVDNSSFVCTTCIPTLSSITLPYYAMGRQASLLIHRQLNGERLSKADFPIFGPGHVVLRDSTPPARHQDRLVTRAMKLFSPDRRTALSVASVAERLQVSDHHLLDRFKHCLGISPIQYIHRTRIAKAQKLLLTTSLPVRTIANHCRYASVQRFGHWFRKLTGRTAMEFRKLGALIE